MLPTNFQSQLERYYFVDQKNKFILDGIAYLVNEKQARFLKRIFLFYNFIPSFGFFALIYLLDPFFGQYFYVFIFFYFLFAFYLYKAYDILIRYLVVHYLGGSYE